jgi:hypothetical protein
MGIWNENGLGIYNTQNATDKQSIMQMQERDRQKKEEAIRQQQLRVNMTANSMGQSQAPMQPVKKSYPLEGQGVKILTELGDLCGPSMLKSILIDMTQSGDSRERCYAAMHKLTPMSAVTMNLLSDKNPEVRYLAEKRVEAWEEQERKQEILNEVDDGAY